MRPKYTHRKDRLQLIIDLRSCNDFNNMNCSGQFHMFTNMAITNVSK